MLKNLEVILSVSGAALGLLITTVTFLAKFISNAKAKKVAEELIKIGNAVQPLIVEAEKFANYTGAEKKAYVMTHAAVFANKNGLNVDPALISDKIEELVALTKKVNPRVADVIKGEDK